MTGLRLLAPTEESGTGFRGMIGMHPSMVSLYGDIRRAAALDVPILVCGATGTGKELVAAALHDLSPRRGRFVAVNVATLPEHLADSELFGSVRGAFTGAVADRKGLIDGAHDGTLYLDEAADLSPANQAKLLRALETGQIRSVGANRDRPVRFRLVLSTQRPPRELVASGQWREDFYYRVARLPLWIPPLRDRTSDIPLLVNHFLAELGRPPLAPAAAGALASHPWPGNVRELKHAVERAVFTADGEVTVGAVLDAVDAGTAPTPAGAARSARRTLREVEREHIELVLAEAAGNTREAAVILGLSTGQLYSRFAKFGITPPRRR